MRDEGKLHRAIARLPESRRGALLDCIELVGASPVGFYLDRLTDPSQFHQIIIDTRSPHDELKGVFKGGRVAPQWSKILHAIEPHHLFSALKLNPLIWNDSGSKALRKLSTLDPASFCDFTTFIEEQTKLAPKEAIFKIWAKREPQADSILLLTDYLEKKPDLVFVEFVLPRLSEKISIEEALKISSEIDTEPEILKVLARLPRTNGAKIPDIKNIDELRELLLLAQPIKFSSGEAKDWCLGGVLKNALFAYGKLPSRRALVELAASLETIYERDPSHILGDSPAKFFNRLGHTTIRGLRLIARALEKTKDTTSDRFKFAEIVASSLKPFFDGIRWNKRPSTKEKERALVFYLVGLNVSSDFLKLAGVASLSLLLKDKPIDEITDNQFKKLYERHVQALNKLDIDRDSFQWKDSFYPLLTDNNNWQAKRTALNEILVYHSSSPEFTNRAIELAKKWPNIKDVKPIVEFYKDRSLEVLELIFIQKESNRAKILGAISEAKPRDVEAFIKTLGLLNGSRVHFSWRLDEKRADYATLKTQSDRISIEDGASLAKIVSPFFPEDFVSAYLQWDPGEFQKAFRLLKVIVGEKNLAKALELLPQNESELDLFLDWFSKQNYASRKIFIEDLLEGRVNRSWQAKKISTTPFGLLASLPDDLNLGERVSIGTMQLHQATGEGGVEYIKQWFKDYKEDLTKTAKAHKEELILKIAKAKSSDFDPVTDLETIASYGKRLKDENKIDLIEAVLNLAPLWGNLTDYDLALMSEAEVRAVLEQNQLNETARFAHKINESAKERHARQLLREIEFYKEFLQTEKPKTDTTEIEDEGLVDKLNRRYAPVAERQEFNALRLRKVMNQTEDTEITEYLVYAFAQRTKDHKSLHDLKNQLRSLVSNQQREIIEELNQRLFLNYTPKGSDIDESVRHLAETAWEVRLGEYETIEEILDVGLEGTNLHLETLGVRIVSAYPEIRLLLNSEHPLLIKEALKWVSEVLEEVPEVKASAPPNYKSSRQNFSIGLRKVREEFDLMIGPFQEPDSYGVLTAETPLGEKLLGVVAIRADKIVGITPTVALLYSGKIPGIVHRDVKPAFQRLKQTIF